MILLNVNLSHIYGFDDFHISFTYPRKLSVSLIGEETLEGRDRFRYKKAVVLMGTNATGKTSLGRALLKIFSAIKEANEALLRDLCSGDAPARFQVDFVNEGYILHRLCGVVDGEEISFRYFSSEIGELDSYENAAKKLTERTAAVAGSFRTLKNMIGPLEFRFAYPEIEPSLRLAEVKKSVLLKTLRAVIGTLDPTLTDVSVAKDLKDSFVIRRRGKEIIIQEGKLLNRELLSSGTAEGIDIAVFLASMLSGRNSFYYCDEHFSYIQSDIEKRIFGLMVERLGRNEQLIFTTHNTDMLNLNLPKHAFAFLRREIEDGECTVSVVYASDILKRHTDSVKCAMENDVFGSLPDDSLLDDLEDA
jgi:energy-coupling factor transporter ATP-binding protein EcfA2